MTTRLQTRFTGIAAGLVLVILLVGLPALLVGTYPSRVPAIESWDEFLAFLGRPDDGTLAMLAIWGTGWVVWAILAGLICTELIAAVRGVQAPLWPGMGRPQHAIRALVAAAVLALLPAPALDTLTAPPAMAQTPHPPADDAPIRTAKTTSNTTEYVVKRGDSLWRIAERHLGDGEQYPEIVALNSRLLHRGPDFLRVGWTLRLPTISANYPSIDYDSYIVKRGDTLSDIARDHLGSPHKWQTIANASRHIAQPDGRRLTDPNQIDIGWTLHIPRPTTHPTPVESEPDPPTHTPADSDESAPATTPQPSPTPSQQSTESPQQPLEEPTPPADELNEPPQSDNATPAWMLAGLTGAGTLLAGSLWFTLQRKRRLQIRHRRPGRATRVPPPELAPVERTARAVATAGAGDHIRHLDATLKTLARQQTAAGKSMPRLSAIQLASEGITLHLAPPFVTLPTPWKGAADRWSISASDLSDHDPAMADQAAPYPLLVTVGEDDHGDVWLLNLEQAGVVDVHGDEDYADDFARHLVAEIAVNPWSEDVRATCLGIGEELVDLDPTRIIHHSAEQPPDLAAGVAAMTDRLTAEGCVDMTAARAREAGYDVWDSRVLFLSCQHPQGAEPVVGLIQSQPLRTGTAVVLVNQPGQTTSAEERLPLHLSDVGRLACEELGLDLLPAGLTSDEARGCAALLANADDLRDTPMPPVVDVQEGWRACIDQAGALRDELTLPRHSGADDLSRTLLPRADAAYIDAAATTVGDLNRLAPQATDEAPRKVASVDSSLDDDVADWFNPVSIRPKLTLLGPLSAECGTTGRPEAVHARRAYFTELLAYLATRGHGATTEKVADAMGIQTGRVRKDIAVVRDWLGVDPATGRTFLPDARKSKAAQTSGIPAYEVEGVLVDADLFRRLRMRGQAAGGGGIDDLRRALSLVSGEPLSRLRRGGGLWLDDGDRVDQILSFAIVDVAHVVATAALEAGDLAGARQAAEVAIAAAPYEETPRLDYSAAGGSDLGEPRDGFGRALFPIEDDDPDRTRHIERLRNRGEKVR